MVSEGGACSSDKLISKQMFLGAMTPRTIFLLRLATLESTSLSFIVIRKFVSIDSLLMLFFGSCFNSCGQGSSTDSIMVRVPSNGQTRFEPSAFEQTKQLTTFLNLLQFG